MDRRAAAADQPDRQPVEPIAARRLRLLLAPATVCGPAAAQHVRLRQRLLQRLGPAARGDVDPELVIDPPVAHQERPRRRQQHRIARVQLPGADVLRGDHAVGHHGRVLAVRGLAGRGELPLGHPPELAHRLDQLRGHGAVIVRVMEAVTGLRQQLAEQPLQEVVEPVGGRRGAVVVDPDAQPLVAPADGMGDAFVHPGRRVRERTQRGARRRLPRIEQGADQHAAADQIESVDRVDQRMGQLGRPHRQPPRRMRQGRQHQQAARRRLLPQRPRRAMRSCGDAVVDQPIEQRKAQRIGQIRRQHDDLSRRDALPDQRRDPRRHPVEHVRVVAVVGEAQHALVADRQALALRGTLRRPQLPCQQALERRQRRRRLREAVHGDRAVARFPEAPTVLRIGAGAQEAPVAGVVVVDHHGGREVGQPGEQQVVRHRRVFLDIVGDQVAVEPDQVAPRRRHRHEVAREHLHLQRKVEQAVTQAVATEIGDAGLHVAIDALLVGVAGAGGAQPIADREVVEADHRRLAEVVEHLAVDAVAVDRQRREAAVAQQRLQHARHVVLGGLQGQEDRFAVRIVEAGPFGDQGPEQLHQPLGQPADGGHGHGRPGRQRRFAQRLAVGPVERPLRQQHQDRIGAHPGLQQAAQALHGGGGLARPGRTGHEQAAAQLRIGDLSLPVGQRDRLQPRLPGGAPLLPDRHSPDSTGPAAVRRPPPPNRTPASHGMDRRRRTRSTCTSTCAAGARW